MRTYLKTKLEQQEGRRNKLYKCSADKLSIGIGHNIQDKGLSDKAIDFIFEEDLLEAENEIKSCVNNFMFLSNVRKYVLINMMFNLGKPKFLGFKRMIAAVEAQDFNEAAVQMKDSKWYGQVGGRSVELVKQMKTNTLNV